MRVHPVCLFFCAFLHYGGSLRLSFAALSKTFLYNFLPTTDVLTTPLFSEQNFDLC